MVLGVAVSRVEDGTMEAERDIVGKGESSGMKEAEELGAPVLKVINDAEKEGVDVDDVNDIGSMERGTDEGAKIGGMTSVGLSELNETGDPKVDNVSVLRIKIGEMHTLVEVVLLSMHVHLIGHQPGVAAECFMIPSALFGASVANTTPVEGRLVSTFTEYL